MITLAFAQMLYYFFVSLEAYGGDDGFSLFSRNTFPGVDLNNDTHFYYLCLSALAIFLFFSFRLVHSRFGMVIRGCKENERRMRSLGFATFRYRLVCFIIAGAGAGLAGALIAAGFASVRIIGGPTHSDRVVALDIFLAAAIALAVAASLSTGRTVFLDVAIGLALVGFVATIGWARLIQRARQTQPGGTPR